MLTRTPVAKGLRSVKPSGKHCFSARPARQARTTCALFDPAALQFTESPSPSTLIVGKPGSPSSSRLKAMKLYDFPLAFNPAKARLILEEKGFTYERQIIHILGSEGVSPWYLKVAPMGTVPCLVDGDKTIAESKDIIEYLDAKGEPLGGPSVSRAAVADWLKVVDAWDGNLFASANMGAGAKLLGFVGSYKQHVAEARQKENPDMAEVYAKKLASMKKNAADAEDPQKAEQNRQQLRSLLDKAEAALAKGQFLAGDQYSAADVIMTPVLNRIGLVGGNSKYIDPLPRVKAYWERIQARPSFKVVFGESKSPTSSAKLVLPDIFKAVFSTITHRY